MPYTISTGAILEFTVRGAVQNQRMLTILHYRFKSGTTFTDGKQALDDFRTAWVTTTGKGALFKACISSEATVLEWRTQWIYPTRYVYQQSSFGGGAGSAGGECMPANVAAALNKRTELAGRHNRGTTHMWGVDRGFVAGGELNGAAIAAYSAFGASLETNVTLTTGQVFEPIIYNRATPNLSAVITQTNIQLTTRTERRRTLGVGE